MFGVNADSALRTGKKQETGSSNVGVQNEAYKALLRRNQAAMIRAVECDFAVANAADPTARAAAVSLLSSEPRSTLSRRRRSCTRRGQAR